HSGASADDLFGHPRGLAVLFASEMWERFSYFGNGALVVLYMVKHLLQGEVEAVLGYGMVKATLEALFGPLDVQPFASQLLGIYLLGQRTLPPDERPRKAAKLSKQPLAPDERRAVMALLLVCALVSLFWATYDQQFNTILLWIEDFTDRSIDLGFWRGEIPTTWFLALNPAMIFVFTPLIVRLWAWQGARGREPVTVSKMAFGCLCVALANLLMVGAAASASAGAKAGAFWLVGYFVLVTIGELFLAPVGLALISRVAHERIRSMMM